MNVTLDEHNKISFSLWDILEQLPEPQLWEAVEILACQEAIIRHVTDQLIEGRTDNGNSGATCSTLATFPTALDRARRDIAKGSSEIVAEEIYKLEEAVKNLKFKLQEHENYERYLHDTYDEKMICFYDWQSKVK